VGYCQQENGLDCMCGRTESGATTEQWSVARDDMSIDDTKKIAEIIQAVMASAGIAIAGIWSYYVFVAGRTFAHNIRIEFSLKNAKSIGEHKTAVVTVTIKNVGRIRAKKDGCWISTSSIPLDDLTTLPLISRLDSPLDLSLSHAKLYPIFDEHDYLEPDEEAKEDVLVKVDALPFFKVGVIFTSSRKKWSSSAILEVKE
jgi:hypothetical protein